VSSTFCIVSVFISLWYNLLVSDSHKKAFSKCPEILCGPFIFQNESLQSKCKVCEHACAYWLVILTVGTRYWAGFFIEGVPNVSILGHFYCTVHFVNFPDYVLGKRPYSIPPTFSQHFLFLVTCLMPTLRGNYGHWELIVEMFFSYVWWEPSRISLDLCFYVF
jgi:hypothetical protein